MALYKTWNAKNRNEVGFLVKISDRFDIKTDLELDIKIDTFISSEDVVAYRLIYNDKSFRIMAVEDDGIIYWISHRGEDYESSNEAILKSLEEIKTKRPILRRCDGVNF